MELVDQILFTIMKNYFFLEINTQPGLTPLSLVPEQLKYRDISFNKLILNLIECAL